MMKKNFVCCGLQLNKCLLGMIGSSCKLSAKQVLQYLSL